MTAAPDVVVEVEEMRKAAAKQARTESRSRLIRQSIRRAVVFVLFLALLALAYTAYKAFGTWIDDAQTDWPLVGSFLPQTNDLVMPPILDIVREFGEPPQRNNPATLGQFIFDGAMFTLREAAVGFAAGLVIGLMLAIVMVRSKWLERGGMPYVIASQTIPLVAIAPIIVIWGRTSLDWLPWTWEDWMSVAVIATYLTFFPVSVNGLRGLQAPSPDSLELMDSYAASWRQVLIKIRLPASLPFLFAALKIAATAAVVGAIVGEISAGVDGGLGRLILDFAGRYTTGPERLYAAVIGAAVLGIVVVGAVAITEKFVLSWRRMEIESS